MDKIDKYFESPLLNQGTLKKLHNPKWILHSVKENDKDFYRVGDAIDTILTKGKHEFDNNFIVLSMNRPLGKMGLFIDNLPPDLTKDSEEELYTKAYEASTYKNKINKIIENFWKEPRYTEYYYNKCNAGDKTILTMDEYEQVLHCYEYLINNPWTRPYFMPKENTKVLYQVDLYFTLEGVECKALLDGVLIDTKNKTIRMWDLKTTGMSISGFKNSFLRFGYHIQAAFYHTALTKCLDKDKRLIKYKDYKVLPPQFIVTEKKGNQSNPARIFECSEKDIKCGMEGGTVRGKKYEGVLDLIEKYKWHLDSQLWDFPKEMYDNGGVTEINIFD